MCADIPNAVALELSGVTHSYGASPVLQDLSLTLRSGEALAIVGENGAGKSTLMKVMTGVLAPSAGWVRADRTGSALHSTRQARRAGVVLIPQELAYLPADTVANNISIGAWPSSGGLISKSKTEAAARRVMEMVGAWVAETSNYFNYWGEFVGAMAYAMAKGVKPPKQTYPPQNVISKANYAKYFTTAGSVKQFPALPNGSEYLVSKGGGILQRAGNVGGVK